MRVCCVLACDAAFFYQSQACIETIRAAARVIKGATVDIRFVGIDLRAEQLAWLADQAIGVFSDLSRLPLFADAPRHAYALTCRPELPVLFPGYDAYMWVDSDIRFLHPLGLVCYLQALRQPPIAIAIAQETEAAYVINYNAGSSRAYHSAKLSRLLDVYGADIAGRLQYFTCFNAGLFAAPADSPLWDAYRERLAQALCWPFNPMREQDALNVALMISEMVIAPMPSVANWLCSQSMPVRGADGKWRHPWENDREILVAHLTNSTQAVDTADGHMDLYQYYRANGLTR